MATLLEAWTAGVWLCDAVEAFTSVRAKRKKAQQPPLSNGWQMLADSDPANREMWLRSGAQLHEMAANMSASSELVRRKRDQFIGRVIRGELVALGYLATSAADDPPTKIPIHLFEDKNIKWNNSVIKSDHFEFKMVKIAEQSLLGIDQLNSISAIQFDSNGSFPAIQPGPKSQAEFLLSIYDNLQDNGKIPANHNLKVAWVEVRKVAIERDRDRARFPGERGLDYKTFARHHLNRRKLQSNS